MRRAATALAVLAFLYGCSSGSSDGGAAASQRSTAPAAVTPAAVTTSQTPTGPVPRYGTRRCWPIVLVHGFTGFRNLGPLPYWFGIKGALEKRGFEVYVCADKPWATAQERAEQVRDQIRARYPDKRVKVNLIGHSMGGLDVRWLASPKGLAFGERISSIMTMGTPHRGSTVSDVAYSFIPGPLVDATNVLLGLFDQNVNGGAQLTTWYCNTVFNPATPDDPNVAYYSWTGTADPTGLRTGARLQAFFLPTWTILHRVEGENDGLVSVTSAKWGTFRGIVPADHLHEVGQIAGLTPSFDHEKFYCDWADELEARGHGP